MSEDALLGEVIVFFLIILFLAIIFVSIIEFTGIGKNISSRREITMAKCCFEGVCYCTENYCSNESCSRLIEEKQEIKDG